MTENEVLEPAELKNELGSVEIAPEVIEVIAGIAANEIEGIAQMKGNFAAGVVERLGRKNHGKGVRVEITEEGIRIDVYCVIKFGTSIPTVATKAQQNIRQTLLNMTALQVAEVNVHIVGIQFENSKVEQEIIE